MKREKGSDFGFGRPPRSVGDNTSDFSAVAGRQYLVAAAGSRSKNSVRIFRERDVDFYATFGLSKASIWKCGRQRWRRTETVVDSERRHSYHGNGNFRSSLRHSFKFEASSVKQERPGGRAIAD